MSHYSNNPEHVRVDFFKESGKWADTTMVVMDGYDYGKCLIHESLINALHKMEIERGRPSYRGLQVICLDPNHQDSHPISIKEWNGKDAWLENEERIIKEIQKKTMEREYEEIKMSRVRATFEIGRIER